MRFPPLPRLSNSPFFAELPYTCEIKFTVLIVEIVISENSNPGP